MLPELDINYTIEHSAEGDEIWCLENEKTVTLFCGKIVFVKQKTAYEVLA